MFARNHRSGRRYSAPAPVPAGPARLTWLSGEINPGLVFDLELPLDQVAQGYAAMDERRAIKTICGRRHERQPGTHRSAR
jgi:hypothetical protein